MKLYLVISAALEDMVWEDWFNRVGHQEFYRIAELVLAEKPSQAKWTAWATDHKTFDGNVLEIPRFSIQCLGQFPQESKRRVVSKDPGFARYWDADDPSCTWPPLHDDNSGGIQCQS